MNLLLLFSEAESTLSLIEKFLLVVVPSVLTFIGTYLMTRPKQNSEVRRTDAETILMYQEKIDVWIGRFEQAKEDARNEEDEFDKTRRDLKKCLERNGNCQEFRAKLRLLLDKIDATFKDMADYAPVLDELRKMKAEVENVKES